MPSPRSFDPNTLPFNDPHVSRKVAIVTGGNAGLGYFTVLHLYMHGWTVYMGSRNPTKAYKAINDITLQASQRQKAGKLPSNAVFGELKFWQLNLGSLQETKKGLIRFLETETQLDLLVNNAGVMGQPLQISQDGVDVQMQTNHLSPFYMTINLIPLLEESAARSKADKNSNGQSTQPRVVFLSSDAHFLTTNPSDLAATYSSGPNFFGTWLRYGTSKLANIHTAKALAERFPSSFLTIAVHPGICANTELGNHLKSTWVFGLINVIFFWIVSFFAGISNEQGAYNTLYAALSPELETATASSKEGNKKPIKNGDYLTPVGVNTTPSSAARNPLSIANSWKWTTDKLISEKYMTESEAQALQEPLEKESLEVYRELKL